MAEVARALRAFAELPTVTVEDASIVAVALDPAETGMDFADATHLGKSTYCESLATFDRKFVQAARVAGNRGVREARSEGRRGGKECVRTCRYRWSPHN